VEQMAETLAAKGYRVAPYHAGMTDEARKKNQEDFTEEKIDTMLAEKTELSRQIIPDSGEAWITEMDNRELMRLFTLSL